MIQKMSLNLSACRKIYIIRESKHKLFIQRLTTEEFHHSVSQKSKRDSIRLKLRLGAIRIFDESLLIQLNIPDKICVIQKKTTKRRIINLDEGSFVDAIYLVFFFSDFASPFDFSFFSGAGFSSG